jgi:hypothetical protein
MPTFTDPVRDAAEASNALRGLAHATRSFDDPAQTYPVIGDLLAGVRSLRQVVDQLGAAHLSHQHQAADDAGSPEAGAAAVSAADSELRQAAALLDAVEGRLDTAMQHSGRIAWHTDPTVYLTAPAATELQTLTQDTAAVEPVSRRWISVVFLQGEEADEVLDVIDRDGPRAGIEHLARWDYGTETTDAALVNGYVYDEPPNGLLDRTITDGNYTLIYNPSLGHASLLRALDIPPDPELLDPAPTPAFGRYVGIGRTDQPTGPASRGVRAAAGRSERRTPDFTSFERTRAASADSPERGVSW